MILTVLAAASENNVIGDHGKIPWKLPRDFARLKELTMGKPIIMGRKTYESIGRPLPGRTNIVITKKDMDINGCIVVHSLPDAIAYAKENGANEAFIFGGGELYAQSMDMADRIELTRVHGTVQGDAFFPIIHHEKWKEVWREDHAKDAEHSFGFSFIRYEKIRD